MIIELLELVTKDKKINIDSNVDIPLELIESSDIRKLSNVHFTGVLSKLIDDTYELSGTITGTMIIPDNITLEDYTDIKEGDIFESFIIEEYRED